MVGGGWRLFLKRELVWCFWYRGDIVFLRILVGGCLGDRVGGRDVKGMKEDGFFC